MGWKRCDWLEAVSGVEVLSAESLAAQAARLAVALDVGVANVGTPARLLELRSGVDQSRGPRSFFGAADFGTFTGTIAAP